MNAPFFFFSVVIPCHASCNPIVFHQALWWHIPFPTIFSSVLLNSSVCLSFFAHIKFLSPVFCFVLCFSCLPFFSFLLQIVFWGWFCRAVIVSLNFAQQCIVVDLQRQVDKGVFAKIGGHWLRPLHDYAVSCRTGEERHPDDSVRRIIMTWLSVFVGGSTGRFDLITCLQIFHHCVFKTPRICQMTNI